MIVSFLFVTPLWIHSALAFPSHLQQQVSGRSVTSFATRVLSSPTKLGEKDVEALPELNDSNYRDCLIGGRGDNKKAVLVDACAPWCGPCKLIESTVINAAAKHAAKLNTYKFNVESDQSKNVKVELLLQGVMPRSLPSLILFEGGQAVATHAGVITADELDEFIESNLQSTASAMTSDRASKKQESEGGADKGQASGFISLAASHGDDDDYMLSGLSM